MLPTCCKKKAYKYKNLEVSFTTHS